MVEKTKIAVGKTEARKENCVSSILKPNFFQPINSPTYQALLLQKTIGNQAVQKLFNSRTIQKKLKIGQ